MRNLKRSLVVGCLAATWLAAPVCRADWLVTRAGERIETSGPWEVRGRMVVFTRTNGALSSMRLSEIDLEASEAATESAAALAAAAPADAAPAPPAEPRPATRVITTADVGQGVAGVISPDQLVERLRQAHAAQDAGLAMALIEWRDVSDDVRAEVEARFDSMMERQIQDIRFVAAEPEPEGEQPAEDDAAYAPYVAAAGRIEIDFVAEQGRDGGSLTFQVATRLGSFFLTAPEAVEE